VTTSLTRPSRRLLGGAVAARLATMSLTTVGYYGAIGRPLVQPTPSGWVPDPPAKTDGSGHVQPYFVLYPGGGGDGPDADLADTATDLTDLYRITAAAGDVDDLMALVDRIDALLNRWTPTVTGVVCGQLKPPAGYSAPLLYDPQFTPNRPYVPLQYQLTATL
jgi:hypothetical protein